MVHVVFKGRPSLLKSNSSEHRFNTASKMNRFKGSMLSETISDYVAPKDSDEDASTDSDGSEAEIGSPEDSEEDNSGFDDEEDIDEYEDMEDDEEEENSEDEAEDHRSSLAKGNAGWADAMSKILKTNKPKKKKTIVLSRAKTIQAAKETAKKKEDVGFEIEGETKEEKPTEEELKSVVKPKKDKSLPTVKRKEWESRGRIKPNMNDHEREKILSKIAIKGVVQLFNAVKKHQSEIESKIKEVGPSEAKKEKVLKSIDKRSFLNVLMGNTKSIPVQDPAKTENTIQLKAEEPKSSAWSVLREDFLTDTTLKDWDKEPEVKEEENEQESLSSDEDDDDAEMT